MTDLTAPAPAPAPAIEPKPNPFARMIGVLFSPDPTFGSIARRPDWVVPLMLFIVVGYISTALILPRMDWGAIAAMQEEQIKAKNPNMSQDDLDRMSRMSAAAGKVFGWIAPLMGVIWYLIVALVLWLAFRLFGGEGTFKQAWSTTLYAWVPLFINGIILTIVAVLRGGLVNPMEMATLVKSNPAFLVDLKAQPVLYALLSSFDVFTIWTVVLLIIGFAIVSRVSKTKAAAIVIPLWVVCILFKLIGPAMQSLRK